MTHTEFKKAIETTLGQPLRALVIGERKNVGPFTRDYTVFNLKKGYCQVSCESTDYSIGIYLWGFGETPLPDGVSPDGHWNIGLRTDGPEQAEANLKTLARRLAQIGYVPPAAPEAPVKQGEPDAGLSGDIYSEVAKILGVPRSEAKKAMLAMMARMDVEKNGFPGKKLIETAREFVAAEESWEKELGDPAHSFVSEFKEALAELDSCKPAAGLIFTENQKHILRDALNNYILDRVTKGLGESPAAVNARDLISKFQ